MEYPRVYCGFRKRWRTQVVRFAVSPTGRVSTAKGHIQWHGTDDLVDKEELVRRMDAQGLRLRKGYHWGELLDYTTLKPYQDSLATAKG